MEEFIENYAQIPQSKRVLYALIAGVVIVVLFLLGVHNEEQDRFERMQNQVTKLDRDVTKKRAYVQNMEKYKQRFQQLELELARAKTVLPDTADVAQLLSVLGNRARDVGLSIDRFEPLGETTKDFYSEILLRCGLKAPTTKLRHISTQLERWTALSTLQGFGCRTLPLRINA